MRYAATLVVVIALLIALPTTADEELWIPAAASNPGLHGTTWTSRIRLDPQSRLGRTNRGYRRRSSPSRPAPPTPRTVVIELAAEEHVKTLGRCGDALRRAPPGSHSAALDSTVLRPDREPRTTAGPRAPSARAFRLSQPVSPRRPSPFSAPPTGRATTASAPTSESSTPVPTKCRSRSPHVMPAPSPISASTASISGRTAGSRPMFSICWASPIRTWSSPMSASSGAAICWAISHRSTTAPVTERSSPHLWANTIRVDPSNWELGLRRHLT